MTGGVWRATFLTATLSGCYLDSCSPRPPPYPHYAQSNVRLPPLGFLPDSSNNQAEIFVLVFVKTGIDAWNEKDDVIVAEGLKWHVGGADKPASEVPGLGWVVSSEPAGGPMVRRLTFRRQPGSPVQIIQNRVSPGIMPGMENVDPKLLPNQGLTWVLTRESCPHVTWVTRPYEPGGPSHFEFGFSEPIDPTSLSSSTVGVVAPDGTVFPVTDPAVVTRTNEDWTTEDVLTASMPAPPLALAEQPYWMISLHGLRGKSGAEFAGHFDGFNPGPDGGGSYGDIYDCRPADFHMTLPAGMIDGDTRLYLVRPPREY